MTDSILIWLWGNHLSERTKLESCARVQSKYINFMIKSISSNSYLNAYNITLLVCTFHPNSQIINTHKWHEMIKNLNFCTLELNRDLLGEPGLLDGAAFFLDASLVGVTPLLTRLLFIEESCRKKMQEAVDLSNKFQNNPQ